MPHRKSVSVLTILILTLSLLAAGTGILSSGGTGEHTVTSIHDTAVQIFGSGIYRNDSVSAAVQAVAQDWVTVFVGIPLLLISMIFAGKGSLRARLLLAGTLAYFLYTYTSYTFLCMYNVLFLIYVALMSISFFAFTLVMMSFEMKMLEDSFSKKLPVKTIAIFMIVFSVLVGLMWLNRIIPPLMSGTVPSVLEHYTTLVIQAMDLGFIVPVSVLSAALLLKRRPFGLLLSSVMCMKGLTMLTCLSAMVINQVISGIKIPVGEMVLFPLANIFVIYLVVVLMKSIVEQRPNSPAI